jgi:EAL domain-containing protein (putative c-di-GMP-specific phosphodiesterase class I)
MAEWCLERVAADGQDALAPIERFPFVVGRDPGCDLAIASAQTSRHHARIEQETSGLLRLTDLESGNGTFINRQPIRGTTLIADGDVIHFGVTEFRLRRVDGDVARRLAQQSSDQTILFRGSAPALSDHFVVEEAKFHRLLKAGAVRAALQPIVQSHDGRLFAYEALGRGCLSDLPQSPAELFSLAVRLDKEVELSEAFRFALASDAAMLPADSVYFVNSHPQEMFSERFYASIERLRAALPRAKLVIEVHETAVTRVADVRAMAERLGGMHVRFAYDDFGAGQARLLELAEVPPHFVKFDMGLIRGLDRANLVKQQLVSQLVQLVHNVGAIALAEGVETAEEARVCVDIGFDLIQGYFTGKPAFPETAWATQPNYVATALQAIAREARGARIAQPG